VLDGLYQLSLVTHLLILVADHERLISVNLQSSQPLTTLIFLYSVHTQLLDTFGIMLFF